MQIAERQTFGQYPRCSDRMSEELTRAPPRVSPERYPPRSAQRPRPGCWRRLRDSSALDRLSSMADRLPRPRRAALRRRRVILSLPGALPSALFPRRRKYVRKRRDSKLPPPTSLPGKGKGFFLLAQLFFLGFAGSPVGVGKGQSALSLSSPKTLGGDGEKIRQKRLLYESFLILIIKLYYT